MANFNHLKNRVQEAYDYLDKLEKFWLRGGDPSVNLNESYSHGVRMAREACETILRNLQSKTATLSPQEQYIIESSKQALNKSCEQLKATVSHANVNDAIARCHMETARVEAEVNKGYISEKSAGERLSKIGKYINEVAREFGGDGLAATSEQLEKFERFAEAFDALDKSLDVKNDAVKHTSSWKAISEKNYDYANAERQANNQLENSNAMLRRLDEILSQGFAVDDQTEYEIISFCNMISEMADGYKSGLEEADKAFEGIYGISKNLDQIAQKMVRSETISEDEKREVFNICNRVDDQVKENNTAAKKVEAEQKIEEVSLSEKTIRYAKYFSAKTPEKLVDTTVEVAQQSYEESKEYYKQNKESISQLDASQNIESIETQQPDNAQTTQEEQIAEEAQIVPEEVKEETSDETVQEEINEASTSETAQEKADESQVPQLNVEEIKDETAQEQLEDNQTEQEEVKDEIIAEESHEEQIDQDHLEAPDDFPYDEFEDLGNKIENSTATRQNCERFLELCDKKFPELLDTKDEELEQAIEEQLEDSIEQNYSEGLDDFPYEEFEELSNKVENRTATRANYERFLELCDKKFPNDEYEKLGNKILNNTDTHEDRKRYSELYDLKHKYSQKQTKSTQKSQYNEASKTKQEEAAKMPNEQEEVKDEIRREELKEEQQQDVVEPLNMEDNKAGSELLPDQEVNNVSENNNNIKSQSNKKPQQSISQRFEQVLITFKKVWHKFELDLENIRSEHPDLQADLVTLSFLQDGNY